MHHINRFIVKADETNHTIKKRQLYHELSGLLIGDPYGIRTRECMRERHVS